MKKNDDDLLKVASEVVKELTSIGDLKVMLNPDVAAKFKYYYEVDNEDILLFDPKPVKGFGASHLALDDIHYNAFPLPNDSDDVVHSDADGPDLICTLGGDGLLMYASHLFPASSRSSLARPMDRTSWISKYIECPCSSLHKHVSKNYQL